MRLYRKSLPGLLAWVIPLFVLSVTAAHAQEFRGRINGVVTDDSGAILPGVTVTATSPALIRPQVQTTGEDGTYRLIALPAGLYTVTFDIPGFTTLKREGIRVVINQTLTVDAQLQVARLQETVTVTGESPVVDTSTTTVGTNFTKELLTEIPNARDIWAAMAQAPGFQMTGYDVGGSHTGTQTGFLAYGVSQQRTTRIEGVNTTEATDANAGYFDFGSFQEFQLGGAGNMADQDTPGASMNITIKSGGDRFMGTMYADWEGDPTITDNVPDEYRTAGRQGNGFFVRQPLQRGNPIDRQYDINGDVGGPLWKQKAWFYYSYRLNDQYKNVLNFDELARSKLSNQYTFKGTFQLNRNNQIIGYLNKREKLQALRDLGPDVPVSAAYFQSSRNYPMKIEWTSVLGDNMFLDVLAGNWYNFFPLTPQTEVGAFPVDQFVPGRLDINTNRRMAGGANITYQNQRRYKPQFAASLSWFKAGWHGSHDFKFGSEGRRERRLFLAPQPFNHVYYDAVLGVTPQEVEFYNTPNDGINQTNNVSGYVQDTWRFNKKLTLNLGFRVDYYKDGFPEQSVNPEGVPGLIGAVTDANLMALWTPFTVQETWLSETTTFGPRAGFAYDIAGDGKSVIKGFYGRFYFNSAPDTIAASVNPVGRTRLRYRWNDLNGNLRIDNSQELGTFVRTVTGALPGAAGVTVDPNLERPFGEELSAHFERELTEGLSGRVSYVFKSIRNEWDIVDANRINAYTTPFSARDPGPDNVLGNGDDGPAMSLVDRTEVPERRVFMNAPGNDSRYDTVELAINRRFRGNWMFLTSFEYTWLDQFHSTDSTTSADGAAGNAKQYYWQPNRARFGTETSSLWNYKILGRYVLPWDVGISGSYKLQSGRNYGRSISVTLPIARAEILRVEPVNTNRAPNVAITDLRFDKSFKLGRLGRFTGMVDVFNLFNSDTVTTFRTTTVNFMEVTSLLDPRIVRFGVRYEF
jgi:outer membrane receptor protein involved in Fe transport